MAKFVITVEVEVEDPALYPASAAEAAEEMHRSWTFGNDQWGWEESVVRSAHWEGRP